jgi:hypothetical protein
LCFTRSFATAAPIPELAPVTTATRPDHRSIVTMRQREREKRIRNTKIIMYSGVTEYLLEITLKWNKIYATLYCCEEVPNIKFFHSSLSNNFADIRGMCHIISLFTVLVYTS